MLIAAMKSFVAISPSVVHDTLLHGREMPEAHNFIISSGGI